MKEQDLKKLFEQAGKASASDEARMRAKHAAMQAFENAQEEQKTSEDAQGNRSGNRPISENNNLIGRIMMHLSNRWLMGGFATAGLIGLVFVTTWQARQTQVDAPLVASRFDQETNVGIQPVEELAKPKAPQEVARVHKERELAVAESEALERRDFAIASKKQRIAAPQMTGIANDAFNVIERDDRFQQFDENRVKSVSDEPFSTFSIDVDTSSYSYVRKMLNRGNLPADDAVRTEEMINYFDYNYPVTGDREEPFLASVGISDAPWKQGNKLVHIGIKAFEAPAEKQPDSNLVFLLDISGSMSAEDKLPLVKKSLHLLLGQLKPTDTVSIVTYAGGTGVVLEATPVAEKQKIVAALETLAAGGSTAGESAIQLAYNLAEAGFKKDAVNRIILATDGDFNVGISDPDKLKELVEKKRESGVFLSVLGFGDGNYRDDIMQSLAQNGNGVAAYIDTFSEAYKVLVEEAFSSLFTVAKDVKIQVEFNPATVSEYRLIGYETRALNREDFKNDKVDAGDVGSGHTVTAIYEITPVGSNSGLLDAPHYDANRRTHKPQAYSDEYGQLKIRYKQPESNTSLLISKPLMAGQEMSDSLAREFNFATAVAGFAQILKGRSYVDWDYKDVIEMAKKNLGEDPYGYRSELVGLARKAAIIELEESNE
ncbi:hypothetical protein BOW28_09025 [Solemya velum gill symbiont]|uniref:vWA domain-containing protein n=1 Tax=Solemya velum gill symbiont TaxID=2340 RepID=UPI00099731A0|nr:VWA domain-containing protein [Solemya velum gill symbiont]OOZ16737.1 hypothetical protein BOW28_09025 [Solemya velum gill symbiont]OOZ26175.1 hypothetical protein BOW32_09295 [Solemya velum gill symbiont]